MTAIFFFSVQGANGSRLGAFMNRAGVMTTLIVGVFGCTEAGRSEQPPSDENVLRAWQPLAAAPDVKRLSGEDCTAGGRDACSEGVCIHVQPEVDQGYFCSTLCDDDDACPEGWGCRPIVPGESTSYCLPPASWTARPAQRRTRRSVAKPALPAALPPLPVSTGGVR